MRLIEITHFSQNTLLNNESEFKLRSVLYFLSVRFVTSFACVVEKELSWRQSFNFDCKETSD